MGVRRVGRHGDLPLRLHPASEHLRTRGLSPVDFVRCSKQEGSKMDLEIMRDPRVRSVQWRDLTRLNKIEVVSELIMPAPWLLASLYAARQGWYPVALGLSFVFFLTGLRVVHGAYHYTLGLTRAGCEWVMFVLSVLMLGSMHAVQINHLQ